jgi:heat shock protein HslJ/uncharacterized lipoprotein YbaY
MVSFPAAATESHLTMPFVTRLTFPIQLKVALIVLLAVPGLHAEPATRPITGELTYLPRIALPPTAVAVIELRDGSGTLLAEQRFPTAGRQVPLPFTLEVPAGAEGSLRAALWVGGRPAWLSRTAEVDSDTRLLGSVRLDPFQPLGLASRLRCGDREIEVGLTGGQARMRVDGRVIDLQPVPAASGARFEAADDAGTFLWSKGNHAWASVSGEALPQCLPAVPAPPAVLRAQGNEPGWSLRIGGERLTLLTNYGAHRLETALPEPEADNGTTRYRISDPPLSVRIDERRCSDTMTGMPYPLTVTLETPERTLTGCGGEPRTLLEGGPWQVEAIAGEPVPDDVQVTLEFLGGGRIAGSSGCNRYIGGYTLTGEALEIGRLAGTMMACLEPQMETEQHFTAVLAEVVRFERDGDTLALVTGDDRRIVARR